VNGLGSIVVASLMGSLHCVGMCGGLISFYAANSAPSRVTASAARHESQRWAAHGAYHLTRLAAYASLGAVSGQLGVGLDRLGHGIGWADLGAILAGSVMLVWGALLWPRPARGLVPLRTTAHRSPRFWSWLEARFVALARSARQRPPLVRAALLGLSSALLPCGWLYAFVVLAAGAGSPARGALLLAAFWSGTLPALLGLGLGVQRLTQRWRAQLPRLSALLLLSLGAYNLATRWPAALTSPANAAGAPSCHHAAL